MEKRLSLLGSDAKLKQISDSIPENSKDPLLARLRGKTTRQEFIQAFEGAKKARGEAINEILKKETLSAEEVRLAVGMGPDDAQALEILQKASQAIPQLKDRFAQIERATSIQFERKPISKSNILKTALYITTKQAELEKIGKTFDDAVLKRRETGLAYTLQATKEGVFLIARKKFSVISRAGSFKVARSAAGIYLESKEIFAPSVRVFTNAKEISDRDLHTTRMNETLDEVNYARQFSGQPGFAECHGFIQYTFNVPGQGPIERISIIYSGYEGNILDNRTKLGEQDKPKACKDILGAISTMHKAGIIHGDCKLENYLFRRENTIIELALTDFGYTNEVKKHAGTNYVPSEKGHYKNGSYGSYRGPPWFVGKENYTGDPYVVESYCVGRDMWELLYGPPAPMALEIANAILDDEKAAKTGKPRTIDKTKRDEWAEAIQAAIAEKRKELGTLKFEEMTDMQKMKYIMFELMDTKEKPNHMTVIQANELLHPKK